MKNKLIWFLLLNFSCKTTSNQSETKDIMQAVHIEVLADNPDQYYAFCTDGTWEMISSIEKDRGDMCPHSLKPGQKSDIINIAAFDETHLTVKCRYSSTPKQVKPLEIVGNLVCLPNTAGVDCNKAPLVRDIILRQTYINNEVYNDVWENYRHLPSNPARCEELDKSYQPLLMSYRRYKLILQTNMVCLRRQQLSESELAIQMVPFLESLQETLQNEKNLIIQQQNLCP